MGSLLSLESVVIGSFPTWTYYGGHMAKEKESITSNSNFS